MAEPGHASSVYGRVYVALIALAALTTGIAFVDLGVFAAPAALAVASVKTVLVVLYFMQVRFSSAITRLFAGAGFFFLLILAALTLGDVMTRGWLQRG
jgi:cytochrome c oxidase subunit IV